MDALMRALAFFVLVRCETGGRGDAAFVGDTLYVREGDETKKVESAPAIANVVSRFNK